MKICFCDNRLGGLLGFRIDVIKHFINQGHDVCLVVPPAKTNWDKVGENVPEYVRIIEVKMQPAGQNPLSDIYLLYQYIKIFRKERPDIVFNYTIKPNIYSSIAAKMFGCRVICMLAGLGYMFEGSGLIKSLGLKLYKYGLSKADKVLVLNQMNYDTVLTNRMVPDNKLMLLYGGEGVNLIDYPYTPTNYSKGIIFLMVARVLYDKGYTEFVEAARRLKDIGHHVRFEILGPLAYDSPMGVPREVFEKDMRNGIFHYMGVTNCVKEYVSRPNVVVVLPSKYGEGLNRSLMEACAIGRPIITTNIPGCKETVKDGINGFLVPKNNIGALSDAIQRFIVLSPEEKTNMGMHSYQIAVEQFDIKYVLKVYDSLILQS